MPVRLPDAQRVQSQPLQDVRLGHECSLEAEPTHGSEQDLAARYDHVAAPGRDRRDRRRGAGDGYERARDVDLGYGELGFVEPVADLTPHRGQLTRVRRIG